MSRVMNQRGTLGWKVPIVGHPSLGSGGIGGLLEKKEYWEDVFQGSFFNACYGPDGKLPARSQAFLDKISGKIKLEDTNFWWIAGGYDAVRLVASAVEATGSSDANAIIRHWNSLSSYPGIYGTYSFSPTAHNGFPTNEVVISQADSHPH